MNLPPACIFEGNEMGNYEFNWSGLILWGQDANDQSIRLHELVIRMHHMISQLPSLGHCPLSVLLILVPTCAYQTIKVTVIQLKVAV